MFDPVVGRFINEDPIGLAGGDTNFYRYVGNNTPNAVDPTGNVADLLGILSGALEQTGRILEGIGTLKPGATGEIKNGITNGVRGIREGIRRLDPDRITWDDFPKREDVVPYAQTTYKWVETNHLPTDAVVKKQPDGTFLATLPYYALLPIFNGDGQSYVVESEATPALLEHERRHFRLAIAAATFASQRVQAMVGKGNSPRAAVADLMRQIENFVPRVLGNVDRLQKHRPSNDGMENWDRYIDGLLKSGLERELTR